MSIQSEINRLKQNVSAAFTAIGNKGGTVPSSKVSGNLASAINSIPKGVTVQRKSGTFTTSTSGTATVNCGFKPDAVFLTGTNPMNLNGQCHAGVAFTDGNVNSVETIFASPSTSYLISSFTITQSASGFSVDSRKVNTSMEISYDSNRTVKYIAVKYS